MREKAATLPNVELEQGTMTSFFEDEGTIRDVQYKTKSGKVMQAVAPLIVVCDGRFSNLRCSLCKPQVDVPSCFVGLVLENCELPYPNHGHAILADPSPILFYQISSSEIRCLVDIPGQKIHSLGNGDMEKYLKTIGLLSGLKPCPVWSVLHFVGLPVYGLWMGVRLILGASGILFPIIKAEGVRQMFFLARVTAYHRAPPKKG